jgi:hypothetical protein
MVEMAAKQTTVNPSTQAFVPTSDLRINPLQMMTTAKDLPTQTYQNQTFVF